MTQLRAPRARADNAFAPTRGCATIGDDASGAEDASARSDSAARAFEPARALGDGRPARAVGQPGAFGKAGAGAPFVKRAADRMARGRPAAIRHAGSDAGRIVGTGLRRRRSLAALDQEF